MTTRWPKRDPFEYVRDTETRFDRSFFVPNTYRPGQPSRLRVFYDEDHGLTSITEEQTTSEEPTARALEGTEKGWDITEDEVRWLHRTLGALIERWDSAEKDPEPEIVMWGGRKMRKGQCPPDRRCLACERLGGHLEPVDDPVFPIDAQPT